MQGGESTAVFLATEGEIVLDSSSRTIRVLCENELIDVTWSRYAAGERGPGPHIHRRHVDAFFVVEGELEFDVGPELAAVRARAGTFVLVPPLVVHTFANQSTASATWLNFHAPSTGFLAYVRGDGDAFDSVDAPAAGQLSTADGVVVSPMGDGELLQCESHGLRVVGDTSQLTAIELSLQPGFVKEHNHPDEVNSFFVLEGEVELAVDGEEVAHAGPGTWLCAPPGAAHGLRNTASSAARVLNIRAPGRSAAGQ